MQHVGEGVTSFIYGYNRTSKETLNHLPIQLLTHQSQRPYSYTSPKSRKTKTKAKETIPTPLHFCPHLHLQTFPVSTPPPHPSVIVAKFSVYQCLALLAIICYPTFKLSLICPSQFILLGPFFAGSFRTSNRVAGFTHPRWLFTYAA